MNEIIDNESVVTAQIKCDETLPSSSGILTLGILSIIFIGLGGLIMGIIGTSLSKKSIRLYENNPAKYSEASYSQVKNGRVCGIIGICVSSLALFIVLLFVIANS